MSAAPDKRRNLRLAGFVFAVLGLLCCAVALGVAAHTAWFVRSALNTYGRVVDLDESTDEDGAVTYRPVYVFVDQSGQEHGVHSSSGTSPAQFEIGDTVNVLYLAAKPEKSVMNTFVDLWLLPTVAGSIGGVQLLIGMVFLRQGKKGTQTAVRRGFGSS